MALPAATPCLLLISLLVAVTPVPCACEEPARVATAGDSLIQCYDNPLTNASTNGTESFRASLFSLLAALPSAAAPSGFASLRSESDRAFARGLCFGDAPVPSECLGCLSVAAMKLSSGCGATTRRAGIWSDRCFVAYADTHASSLAEDVFRSRVLLLDHDVDTDTDADEVTYFQLRHAELVALARHVALSAAANVSRARMLGTADAATAKDSSGKATVRSRVHALAQCTGWDRTASECGSCLQASAQAVDWDLDGHRRDSGVAAAVVGSNCYIRFEVSTSLVSRNPNEVWFCILFGVWVLLAACVCAYVDGRTMLNEDNKKFYEMEL